jgi:hypothetical protein
MTVTWNIIFKKYFITENNTDLKNFKGVQLFTYLIHKILTGYQLDWMSLCRHI